MSTQMNGLQMVSFTISNDNIAIGDTITMSFTLRNVTGEKITRFGYGLEIVKSSSPMQPFATIPIYGPNAFSWANNTDKSFSCAVTVPGNGSFANYFYEWQAAAAEQQNYFRHVPLMLRFHKETPNTGGTFNLYDIGQLWDYHCGLTIDNFSVDRATSGVADDEGVEDLTAIRISVGPHYVAGGATLKLYYAAGAVSTSSSYIDLTAHIPTLLSAGAIVVSSYFPDAGVALSAGLDYNFLLEFTDGLDAPTFSSSISRAFANVHLSGASTGGVAFGKFSASTENNPMFECEYPAHFGGRAFFEGGVGSNSLSKVQTVEHSFPLSGAGRYPSDGNLVKPVDCGVGWTPVYVIGYNTNNSYCYPYLLYIDSDSTSANYQKLIARFRYTYTATTGTMDITVYVMCMHTSGVIADTPADYPPIDIVKEYVEGEVPTGATWIDGKPIYRYVYHAASYNTGTGTSTILVHTIPSDIESIVNLYGTAVNTSNGAMYPLNYYLSSTNSQYFSVRNYAHSSQPNGIIMQHSYTTARTYNLTIIVEYTKHTT